MSVSFSLTFILITLFFINTIVTHFFNWWARNAYGDIEEFAVVLAYTLYILVSIFLLVYIS